MEHFSNQFIPPERAPGKRRLKPISSDRMDEIYKIMKDESDESDSTCMDGSVESDGSEQSSFESEIKIEKEMEVPEADGRDPQPHCMICLNDSSKEEVVVCDSCGVSVHEECYGIADNEAIWDNISLESTVSTEPWFCKACLESEMNPSCALCPNSGGAFKKTLCGRWVHLICAMVVPGVLFDADDSFDGISLMEIPYSSYGARKCSICADWRFASTGVTIQCDSGLCKTFFHVSCALRDGFLCSSYEENASGTGFSYFYAQCAQHSTPEQVLKRKRLWTASLLSAQLNMEKIGSYSGDHQKHNKSVLAAMKVKYEKDQREMIKSFDIRGLFGVFSRDLSTSASALRRLLRKAEIMNINTSINVQDFDVSKLWYIPPGFTPAYVHYFLDRDKRIGDMRITLSTLKQENELLREKETKLIQNFEMAKKNTDDSTSIREKMIKLYSHISDITGRVFELQNSINSLPNVQSCGNVMPKFQVAKSSNQSKANIELCSICGSRGQQHLLVRCATCDKSQHIHCLSPPLESVPKIGMGYAWRCSSCHVTVDFKESIQKAASDTPIARVRRPTAKMYVTIPENIQKKKYVKKTKKKSKKEKVKKTESSDLPKPKRKYTKRTKINTNQTTVDQLKPQIPQHTCSSTSADSPQHDSQEDVVNDGRDIKLCDLGEVTLTDSPFVDDSKEGVACSHNDEVTLVSDPEDSIPIMLLTDPAFTTSNNPLLTDQTHIKETTEDKMDTEEGAPVRKLLKTGVRRIGEEIKFSNPPKLQSLGDLKLTCNRTSSITRPITINSAFDSPNISVMVKIDRNCYKCGGVCTSDDPFTSCTTCLNVVHQRCHTNSVPWKCVKCVGIAEKSPLSETVCSPPNVINSQCVVGKRKYTKRKKVDMSPSVKESIGGESKPKVGRPRKNFQRSEPVVTSDLVYTNVVTKSGRITRRVSSIFPDSNDLETTSLFCDPLTREKTSYSSKESDVVISGVLPIKEKESLFGSYQSYEGDSKFSLFSNDVDNPPSVVIGGCYYCGEDVVNQNSFIRCRFCINVVHRSCYSGHFWSCPDCS